MDGWIGLSGCGKWMDVESGCGKWKVARFRISHKSRSSQVNDASLRAVKAMSLCVRIVHETLLQLSIIFNVILRSISAVLTSWNVQKNCEV